MTGPVTTQLHATCVEVDGVGVLILGGPGAGKSDLALRLIDCGARLVADDRTDLHRDGARLTATAPDILKGRIEVRGIGIVPLTDDQVREETVPGLVLRLEDAATIPRLPEPETETILDMDLPLWRIDANTPSAVARVRLLVQAQKRGILRFDDDTR